MNEEDQAPKESTEATEGAPPAQISEPLGTLPASQPATQNQLDNVEREMNTFERSTLRWTRATFGILLVTCIFIGFQWIEMRSGSSDTHELAVQAKRQADASKALADDTKAQSDNTAKLATAAGQQADASKVLADLTATQFAASQQLIESQRASITVAFASVLNPITFHDGALSFAFAVAMKNDGRLSANKVKVRYMPYFSQWGNNIFSEPMERQRDFCGKPNISRDSRVALRGLTNEDALTIVSGDTKEWQINFGMGAPTDSDIIEWPPPESNLPQTKRIYPIVVGCVDYQSGVMTAPHQTGFIFEIKRGDPKLPTFITLGEDVRREDVIVEQYFFGQGKSY